jgi:triphosphoribosyl-dephospho-CoA synthase
MPSHTNFTAGQLAALAAMIEATCPKPGNVHRGADFEDVGYPDFMLSALAIAPVFEAAPRQALGRIVLSAIEATQRYVGTNTNLGMVLLFAPLALVPRNESLEAGLPRVLDALTTDDARQVYEAIRLANPGGLGKVEQADIGAAPPANLLDAMRLAADRDLVARQYTNNFTDVLGSVVPWLRQACGMPNWSLADAVVFTFLQLLAVEPDSLIARKCGVETARQASTRAAQLVQLGGIAHPDYLRSLADFDFWLRSDGHRRNPGTTADLIAAGLFVGLRQGFVAPPFRLAELG